MGQAERQGGTQSESCPAVALFAHHRERCIECWACVRHCPARAIRVVDGRSEVITERCVKCGICVTECGNSGHSVRDDLPLVRELLASERPVVALLATEFIAALHPMTPDEIETRLADAGFTAVETTLLGEELVAAAYESTHSPAASMLPRLRSSCPVAVEWVRRFYPQLVGTLVPIVPPYVAQARLVRELYPEDAAIVYVSPCWARKDEVFEDAFAGDVDVAIGFDELAMLLREVQQAPARDDAPRRRPRAVKELSVTDGFPRRVLAERNLTDSDVAVVRGLGELDLLLAAISRGETAPVVVDMLNCEGCLDGPCVNKDLSVYVKRTVDVSERERQPPPVVDSRAFLAALPAVDLHRSFRAQPAPVANPSVEEIDAVLAAGEFHSRAETIDCGACGFPTCVALAVAIWEGNSGWEMCFPLQRKKLVREREQFAEAAVIDAVTGLMNRRGFDARIAEETARSERYGMPVSLIMLDLDAFKDVNDVHGHTVGDDLLKAVGVLLHSQLRTADSAFRYGGDEFAVLLPNTPKTDAWAVAEKIRGSIARLSISTDSDVTVSATVSIGIAAVGENIRHPSELVAAADKALYAAKRAGRNRVELAAG